MDTKQKITSLVTGDVFLEEVFRAKQLLLAHQENGNIQYGEEIKHNGHIYVPASTGFASSSSFYLPSDVGDPMDTETLARSLKDFIGKYVSVSEGFRTVMARFTMMSWMYDRFTHVPYLRMIGNPGTGKSRYLNVMAAVSRRALVTSDLTAPSLFRVMDQYHPTLLMDEADQLDSTVRKVLRNGFERDRSVLRCKGEQDRWEVGNFDVFGPKVLAGREAWNDDALESRCLTECSDDNRRDSRVPLFLPEAFSDEALKLRNALLRWRFVNYRKIDPEASAIKGVSDRMNQIAIPLLCVTEDPEDREIIHVFVDEAHQRVQQVNSDSREGLIAQVIVSAPKSAWIDGRKGEKGLPNRYILKKANREEDETFDHFKLRTALDRLGLQRGRTAKERYVVMSDALVDRLRARFGFENDDDDA